MRPKNVILYKRALKSARKQENGALEEESRGTNINAAACTLERQEETETSDHPRSQTGWQNLADERIWETSCLL